MPKYEVEDTVTGKAYEFDGDREPTQTEVENYLQGTITRSSLIREKFGEVKRILTEPVPEELRPTFGKRAEDTGANVPLLWALRQIDRPVAAVRSLVAGKSPIEGFVHPERAPMLAESILSNVHTGNDLVDIGISALGGAALDVGTYWMVYGALPKAVSKGYTGLQTKGVDRLRANLIKEYTGIGMSEAEAKGATNMVIARGFGGKANVLQRSPIGLAKASEALEKAPGQLGKQTKFVSDLAKANAERQGFTEEWFKRAKITKPRITDQPGYRQSQAWLQSREPFQSRQITTEEVPLHPAPITGYFASKFGEQGIPLTYLGVPKSVVKDLPNEVILPPTEEWIQKTLSRFPQKVTDQKSLEEVGNAMAKEMGIDTPIKWEFKPYNKKYISGELKYISQVDPTKPDRILIRVPKDKLTIEEQKKVSTLVTVGREGKTGTANPTQGKIKKMIIEELSHKLTPGQGHNTIFRDEVEYHEAVTLIKRELRKQGIPVSKDKLGTPIIQTKSYAGYKVPRGVLVYDAYGEPITTFESEAAAQRWITSAENETQNLVSKEKPKAKPETSLTVDDLVEQPELAQTVLANSSGYSPEVVDLARQIEADVRDTTPALPVEKVKEVSEQGAAIPPKVEDIQKEFTPVIEPSDKGIYNPDQFYNVTYQKVNGNASTTTIKGSFLNTMDSTLNSGKNALDPYGHLVIKIVDAYPLKGDSGRVTLPEWEGLEDALTNLSGQVEVGKEKYLNFIRKIAIPEKVDNPLFKPIYNAVQHGVDYRTELTIVGLKLLDSKFILSLPDDQKASLSLVLKLGNELHKEYTPEELKATFNLGDNQIKAYNNIRRMYEFAFNETVKAKKLSAEYDTLKPNDKIAFDEAVAKTRNNLKGYVSQERLGSEEKPWAVFKPGDTPEDKFFALFSSKAEAEQTARALGSIDYMYLRKNIVNKVTNRLSLVDLEELIDSAGVGDTTEINLLRDEIKKRVALHHEVKRQDIPGYDWNLSNIVESAIDYVEGSSNRLARNFGKKLVDKMYQKNVDMMSTDMKIFSRDFIDSAYNTGSIGFRNISKLLYTWNLALNVKWLVMNGTQPLARTYPVMARYFKTGEVESKFLNSYNIAGRYLKYLGGGGKQGISSDLLFSLNKLHNQGVLGDQATRLMMGVRSVKGEQVEKIIGAFGRFGEFINRSHAATAGYYIGTEKLGLEGKPLVEFMRQFVYKTQVAYGKHNLPLAITRAGDWASFLKMVYTFQHYNLDNLQYINSTMPWHKGAKAGETVRALGALLTVGGIKGLPLLGTGMALYALWKKLHKEGGSLDYDTRKLLTAKNVPPGMQDALLNGIPAVGGVDLSASTRPDLPFVSPQGTVNPGGVPVGMVDKVWQAGTLLKRGEVLRAAEKVSPRALENIQKAIRFHNEGVTKANGELLLGKDKLGWWDIALTGMGFMPTDISKSYERENVKQSFLQARRDASSEFNEQMAKAIFDRNDDKRRKIMQNVREFNAKASPEQRVILDYGSVYNRVREMKGRDVGTPNRLRRKFRELEEVYK